MRSKGRGEFEGEGGGGRGDETEEWRLEGCRGCYKVGKVAGIYNSSSRCPSGG